MPALDIAATGALAQSLYVDVIAQNLANVNTTGYKLQRPEFADLLYENRRQVGVNSSDSGTIVPTGIQLGLGVKTSSIYRDTRPGPLQNTNGTLDLAIQGEGYLQVQLPSGEVAYTRDGALQLDANGDLVTADGYLLTPSITVPQNATGISIDKSGEVFATITGQTAPQNLGQIQLAVFVNQGGLQAIGNNLFTETQASGNPIQGNPNQEQFGAILQGYLENSNVDSVTEITNLIKAQRAYEENTKVITVADQMKQNLIQSIA